MLPDTIWVGPFWIIASIRPGGSGWITRGVGDDDLAAKRAAAASPPSASNLTRIKANAPFR